MGDIQAIAGLQRRFFQSMLTPKTLKILKIKTKLKATRYAFKTATPGDEKYKQNTKAK